MRSLKLCLLVGCLLRLNVAAAASIPTPNSEDHGDSFDYENRIVGGQTTSISSFPYQVSVQRYDKLHCGGSILKPNVVITAANCCHEELSAAAYKVRVGSTQHADGGQLVAVQRIILHENYTRYTLTYDVALLQLADKLQYSDSVQPVQLPEADALLPAMTPLYASGWGCTSIESSAVPSALHYVEVYAIDQQICKHYYDNVITPTMLCAGSDDKDECNEDMGGPLVSISSDKQPTLQGILALGMCVGYEKSPSIYTNVAVVRPWIDAKLVELGAST